ncbi:N-6 DNA methylase [Francisella tularensis]|uniref:N-6 DNA methylase n=2 Tax=Francisella tularensis TaxID=263 RepID=UPI0020CDD51C|nr:N-6 DNA methylase [Francisella tularensis]
MVLEFKAENLELKVEDCYQDYNYATWSRADLFAVSNGKETQVYKVVDTELPLSLKPLGEIPNANIINNAKKLKEELEKTVEFKGDEFAKVLNKCHNIIRNNDKLSPEAAFDEISKVLFIKIMYERNINQNQMFSLDEFKRLRENFREIHKGTSQENDSFIQYRFEQVKREFEKDHIFEPNETIRIRESSFEDIVKELEKYNLTKTGADVKGIAFETFLGRTFRGELGQFFTPRKVVEFMVDVLDIKQNELICDPCAGSGGFLIRAFEIVKDKIDEKYIRLKKLKQREVFGENLENIDDEKLKAKYEQVINELNEKQKLEIQYLSKSSIFGTDANPRMARVSKMNMIMHGDGHNGIHHNDGLLNVNGIFRNRFDVILTNPPFGTNLGKDNSKVSEEDKYTDEKMITHYKKIYGDVYEEELKQVTDNFGKPIRSLYKTGEISGATEVLFVERCLDLLKAGGRMGIVLPEGVLNSSNLQKAREYFESRAKILLIVSLPQDLFVSSGATVKTSLVFLKKFTVEEQEQYETVKTQAEKEAEQKYQPQLLEIQQKIDFEKSIKQHITKLRKALKTKTAKNKENLQLTLDETIVEHTEYKKKVKQYKAQLKELEAKQQEEAKQLIKQKFDYEIPIAEIEKAGVSTIGAEIDNQLPELLKEFKEYYKRK